MDKKETFLKRTSQILDIAIAEAEKVFIQDRKSTLRINTLKVKDTQALLAELLELADLEPVPWCDNAFFIKDGREKLTKSAPYKNAHFYIMNAASLIPPLALSPVKNDVIIDVCAAPGGKTLHIAGITDNKAFIYANDESSSRLGVMKQLLSAHGAEVLHYMSVPAQYLSSNTKQKFDKILVDAPCSGEGLVDLRNSQPMRYWSEKKIRRLSKLQKKILVEAFKTLNVGGALVYSTCTLAPEENEEVIDNLLREFESCVVEEIPLDFSNRLNGLTSWGSKTYKRDVSRCLRVFPTSFMEAFFICKLVKKTVE